MGKRRRGKRNNGDIFTPIIFLCAIVVVLNPDLVRPIIIGVLTILVLGLVVVIFKKYSVPERQKNGFLSSSKIQYAKPKDELKIISPIDKEFENALNTSGNSSRDIPNRWSLDLIKSLDWKCFEDLCASYFRAKGYKAEVTKLGADGGIDVLLYSQQNPTTVVGAVQCKAWGKKPVGVKEIRELLGIMTDLGCPLGNYITTSEFTSDAKAFAENKHIKLLNGTGLFELIKKLPVDVQSNLLSEILVGDYTTPSCPNCGIKLTIRTSKKVSSGGYKFWGCKNYPRCHYKMKIRSEVVELEN